ncbi:MAG: LysO family transporter [Prevotellaceae bacterium]|nr:LysO family transporter [Prevotellaceae bacterium]MDD6112435.1 LysO family transporter [Prevotellaceae bacterium]
MLIIVSIMLCGIGLGYLLRGRNTAAISKIITVLIWALLFLLGIEVGTNPNIIGGLQNLGVEALVLTIGGSVGSVLASWWLWNHVSKGGKA